MQNNGDRKNLHYKEDFFYYYPNGKGGQIKVLNCKKLLPRVKNILEEVAYDIKCVSGYEDIIKHCSYCYSFYFDPKDSDSLHRFKRLGRHDKNAFHLALRKLRAFYPPIIHDVWNKFRLDESDDDFILKDLTGGFCKLCRAISPLGDKIRKEQRKKDIDDCFGRRLVDSCDRKECPHLEDCLVTPEEYCSWLRRFNFLKEMNQYKWKIILR